MQQVLQQIIENQTGFNIGENILVIKDIKILNVLLQTVKIQLKLVGMFIFIQMK